MSSAFQIVARTGPTAGSIYILEGSEIFIGRDLNNDIVINDPEVSRRHARLYKQGAGYALEDLGSTNGSMVNGKRITGPHVLNSGEVIVLGENITLVFEAPVDDHAAATMVAGLGDNATIKAPPSAGEPFRVDPYAGQPPSDEATVADPYAGQPVSPMQAPADPYADPYGGQQQGGFLDPYGGGQPQGGYLDPYGGQPQSGYQDPYGGQPGGYAGQIPDQPSEPIEGKRKLPAILVVAIVLLLVVCICGIGGFIIDSLELYCPLGGPIINSVWPGSCP